MSLTFAPPLPLFTADHPPNSPVSRLLFPAPPPKSHLRGRATAHNHRNTTDLSSDFAAEVRKLNTAAEEREAAMKKSRELLFTELCRYLDLTTSSMEKRWRRMEEEEKWRMIIEFVGSDWSVVFRPLSARKVKEMVEKYVDEEGERDGRSFNLNVNRGLIFSGLKKLMGD